MATTADDAMDDVATETTTRYQVDFSLDKYLNDWPPVLGEDVEDAATYGIVFLSVIGLMFTCCIIVDLDFLRRRIAQLREKKKQKNLKNEESLLGTKPDRKTSGKRKTGRPASAISGGSSAETQSTSARSSRCGTPVVLTPGFSGLRPPKVVPYSSTGESPPPYTKENKLFRAV